MNLKTLKSSSCLHFLLKKPWYLRRIAWSETVSSIMPWMGWTVEPLDHGRSLQFPKENIIFDYMKNEKNDLHSRARAAMDFSLALIVVVLNLEKWHDDELCISRISSRYLLNIHNCTLETGCKRFQGTNQGNSCFSLLMTEAEAMPEWLLFKNHKLFSYSNMVKSKMADVVETPKVETTANLNFIGHVTYNGLISVEMVGTPGDTTPMSCLEGLITKTGFVCIWLFAWSGLESLSDGWMEASGDVGDTPKRTTSIALETETSGILHLILNMLWWMLSSPAIACFESVALGVSFMCRSSSYNRIVILCKSWKIALVCQRELWWSSWLNHGNRPTRKMILFGS